MKERKKKWKKKARRDEPKKKTKEKKGSCRDQFSISLIFLFFFLSYSVLSVSRRRKPTNFPLEVSTSKKTVRKNK